MKELKLCSAKTVRELHAVILLCVEKLQSVEQQLNIANNSTDIKVDFLKLSNKDFSGQFSHSKIHFRAEKVLGV